MKRLFIIACVLTLLMGCNNVSLNSSSSMFGVDVNSSLEEGYLRLIPSTSTGVNNALAYDVQVSSGSVFPYNLYTDKSLTHPWTSDSSDTKLYYDGSQVNQETLLELFGKESLDIEDNASALDVSFDNLYITGDFIIDSYVEGQDLFFPMKREGNIFVFNFVYSESMNKKGSTTGIMKFSFSSIPSYKSGLYGGSTVLCDSRIYSSRHGKEANTLVGLIPGEEYTLTVMEANNQVIKYKLTGRLGNSPFTRNLYLRGSITDDKWVLFKSLDNDGISYYYDFTYERYDDVEYYKESDGTESNYFYVTPINSTILGYWGGTTRSDNPDLSTTYLCRVSRESSYNPTCPSSFMCNKLSEGHRYRVKITRPLGGSIFETKFNISMFEIPQ